jgi:type IV pilus biogenesis protein CpaD/CtpE
MNMRMTPRRIRMKRIALLAMALLSAGCARQPDQIAATPVAADRYLHMSCAELLADRAGRKIEQARLEDAQHRAAEHDKAAMSVIHVPVASMAGQDREDEVARGKGELQALDAATQSKGCA